MAKDQFFDVEESLQWGRIYLDSGGDHNIYIELDKIP